MLDMQACRRAIVLDTQPQLAAICVGEADNGFNQVTVRQARAVALEFDGEGFTGGQLR